MGGRCCLVTGRVFIIVSWCRGEVGYFLLVGAGLPYSRLPGSGSAVTGAEAMLFLEC